MADKGFVIHDLLTFKKATLSCQPTVEEHAYQLKGQHIPVVWHH